MGGKTQTSTTNTSQSYTPAALSQLQDIFNRAQQVSSTPYQPYGGEMVAGLSPTQQTGIANVNAAYGTAQPYYDIAANYATQGASALTPAQIEAYSNPYQRMVTDATLANMREANAQQQQQVIGNAAKIGALGGDRVGVAQAELARQQALANNQTLAGLNQQNYNQALAAAQADRAAAAQGAYAFGNIGGATQNAALQGAQAQIGAGGLEQQNAQNKLTAAYNQYLQQLAFPYQQAQFYAGIGLPAAQAMGGSGSGQSTTTTPGPSVLGQIAGLGMTAAGVMSGNPFMAMGGLGSALGGGGTGYATNPWSTNGVAGPWGAQGPNQAPFYAYARGGRVPDDFIGAVHSIRGALKRGGSVTDTVRDPNGIYVPMGYADGGDVSPLSFDDRWGGMPTGDAGDGFGSLPAARAAISAVGNAAPIDSNATDEWRARTDQAFNVAPPMGAVPATSQGSPDLALGFAGSPRNPYAVPGPATEAAAGTVPQASVPMPVQLPAPVQSGGLGGLSDDARMGLIAAGLGMMASKSPFALSQIGEGGLAGLKTYGDLRKDRATREQQQQRIDLEAKRLADQVEQFAKSHGLQREQLAESIRQHDIAANAPKVVGTSLVNPQTGEVIFKGTSGLLDPDTLKFMAEQYRAGDTSVLTNLGRGAQGAENIAALRQEIQRQNREAGLGGADQAMRNAEFFGTKAGQRTLGTKQANIELAATEFKQVLPVVQAASDAVSRTDYPHFNKIMQAWQQGTGDPNIVRFAGGVNTLINLYARAISPSGVPTVSDKDHAREILDKAWSQGQFKAAVGMMQQEIDAALHSPGKVRDEMRHRFLEGQGGSKPKGAGSLPPAASSPVAPPMPPAVPAGSLYSPSKRMWKAPDGKLFDAEGKPIQ